MQPIPSPLPRSSSPIPPPIFDLAKIHPHHRHVRSPSPTPVFEKSDRRSSQSRSNDIPWKQLIPLMLFRIADAASYVVIFPFIVDMITSFNVAQDRIGLYAGLGEGTLMLVEAVVAPVWAKLADKYGRRPCMLGGFGILLASNAMVGFCSQVWQVIFWRAVFGINPIGVVGKIFASEICHPGNRAKVFSIFSPGFSMGAMVGTFLGGELAHPYGRMPWWLGGTTELWKRWPYGLPCVVTAGIGGLAVFIGYFTLEETLPPHDEKHDTHSTQKKSDIASYRAALKVPHFVVITVVFCCFQLATMSWDGVFSNYTYTDVSKGGLGLPVDAIGLIMSCTSILYIATTPFILPRFQARLGSVKTLAWVTLTWPMLALLIPLAQKFAVSSRPMMWLVLLLQQTTKNFGNFAWPLCDMLTVGVFDEQPHLLAVGSAISLIAGAFGRAIGPAGLGWIYSISTQYQAGTWGRQIPWLTFLVISMIPVILVRLLTEEKDVSRGTYEAVPLVEAGRGSLADEDDEERLYETGTVRATGREV